MDATFLVQLLVDGLAIGLIYALLAVGLSLIFGVLQIVNFAHGEFYMLGAMGVALAIGSLGLPYWPAAVLAVTVVCLGGCALFELLLRVGGARDFEHSLMMTLGLSLILQNGAIYLVSATPRIVDTGFSFGRVEWADVSLSVPRLVAVGVSLASFLGLYLVLHRTRAGQAMRGVSQSRDAALMVGIRPLAIARLAVLLGVALSAIAGAVLAPVYAVHPAMGLPVVFKAFAVVIIGGLGRLEGAAVAALGLGVLESFAGGLGDTVIRDALAFVLMILVLLVRPEGLFARGVRI